MSVNICTLFNKEYLVKGLLMLESFFKHHPNGTAWVMPCDRESYRALRDYRRSADHWEDLTVLPAPGDIDFAGVFPGLEACLSSRKGGEYFFTLTPFLMAYVLQEMQETGEQGLVYVDADCFFLASTPNNVLDRMHEQDILITPHRWTPEHATRLRPNGTFNVGWLYLSGKGNSVPALKHWMVDCLHPPKKEPSGRFSDQLLLEDWPEKYGKSVVLDHLGINLAPWNQKQYDYGVTDREQFVVNELRPDGSSSPVVLYHFHEFQAALGDRQLMDMLGHPCVTVKRTGYDLHPMVVERIYKPYEALYLKKLLELEEQSGTKGK